MKGVRHHKVGRKEKDKSRRMAVKDDSYRMKIKRKAPPQAEKKVVVRQELVKDPKTGKAEYKNVYEVKDVENKALNKKLKNTLYIPHAPPQKEFKYLRPVKAHHISNTKKYQDPKSKYGDLGAYKKSRLLELAKDKYDLNEKLAKKLDKEEVIDFINKRYAGHVNLENKYARTKFKLEKIESIKPAAIKIKPSADPTKPWKKEAQFGIIKVKGTRKETAEEKLNRSLPLRYGPAYRTFGQKRGFDAGIYTRFKEGRAGLEELADELATHLNISDAEKLKLMHLDPKQLERMYKKAYKVSLKPESERYEQKIYLPKLEYQRAPNFARAPQFLDYTGAPHAVGLGIAPPISYTEIDSKFDYADYGKPKEIRKLEKLDERFPKTNTFKAFDQSVTDLNKELLTKEKALITAITQGDQQVTINLSKDIQNLKSQLGQLQSKSAAPPAPPPPPPKAPKKKRK